MEERELKSLLMQRLHLELLLFKDRILQKEKEDIFKSSYEIEIHVDLYEILVERADLLKKEALRGLLHLNTGILGSFYQEWMDRKDGEHQASSIPQLATLPPQGTYRSARWVLRGTERICGRPA